MVGKFSSVFGKFCSVFGTRWPVLGAPCLVFAEGRAVLPCLKWSCIMFSRFCEMLASVAEGRGALPCPKSRIMFSKSCEMLAYIS